MELDWWQKSACSMSVCVCVCVREQVSERKTCKGTCIYVCFEMLENGRRMVEWLDGHVLLLSSYELLLWWLDSTFLSVDSVWMYFKMLMKPPQAENYSTGRYQSTIYCATWRKCTKCTTGNGLNGFTHTVTFSLDVYLFKTCSKRFTFGTLCYKP